MAGLYSDDELIEIIDSEGLGYAITSYLNSDRIEDETTRELWKECEEKLRKLQDHLGI